MFQCHHQVSMAALLGCVFVGTGTLSAADMSSDLAKIQKQYSGNWVRAGAVEASLGFAGPIRQFSGGKMQIPQTIEIKIEETLDSETVELMQPLLRTIPHRLVATGQFRFGKSKRTICVVARYNDATYLWHGALSVGALDTKVSFIPGAKRDHDLLFLEWFPDIDRGVPAIAAYKRSKE